MKVFIIEGCHGVGKTTLINKVKYLNYDWLEIVDETFLEGNEFPLSSSIHQYDWLLKWVKKIVKLDDIGKTTILCDRGPTSASIYSNVDNKLKTDILKYLESKNIIIKEFYMPNIELEEHFKRILERSSVLIDEELKNLISVREKYDECFKYSETIDNIDDLIFKIKTNLKI